MTEKFGMFFIFLYEFVAFPERNDAILIKAHKQNDVISSSSGQIGQYINGKCVDTFPNNTIGEDNKWNDWCSNLAKNNDPQAQPWISYSVKNRVLKFSAYSIRSGCCLYDCCCIEGAYVSCCCCELYSFELQGSNDGKEWTTVHKVEKENQLTYCKSKTYEIGKTVNYRFVRLKLISPYPGCDPCMAINGFEIYGEALKGDYYTANEENENDESVSIIGKVKKHDSE